MDKFLKALQKGEVSFTQTDEPPLRTLKEMHRLLKLTYQKPRGRKPQMVEIDGEERSLKEWAEFLEVDYERLYYFYHHRKLRGRKLIEATRTVKPRKPSF